jgi:membrane associated rhomboid family serine protease
MTETEPNLPLAVLQRIADARQPLPAGALLRDTGATPEDLNFCLDAFLRVQALELVRGGEGEVPLLSLTDRGRRLIAEPELMARFSKGEGLEFGGPAAEQRRTIRRLLITPARPRAARFLFWLNIAVFCVGLFLAWRKDVAADYFNPIKVTRRGLMATNNPVVLETLRDIGLLSQSDLKNDIWWRLLTCGFVHIGILHIVMNMWAFRVLGTDGEWMWGGVRFAILYFLALWGGSCAAITTAMNVGGASGALCGLMAAEGAWLFLNRKHLPRRLVRSQMTSIFLSGLLIVFISMAPGVSGAGHLGGAVVGLVAAVLLHFNRFGGTAVKAVTALLLVTLPVGCYLGAKEYKPNARQQQPAGKGDDEAKRYDTLDEDFVATDNAALDFFKTHLGKLIEVHPARRDAEEVKDSLKKLPDQIERLRKAYNRFLATPVFENPAGEQARVAGSEYFQKMSEMFEDCKRVLEGKLAWGKKEQDRRDKLRVVRERAYDAIKAARQQLDK